MDGFAYNKYPAICFRCGGHCRPAAGRLVLPSEAMLNLWRARGFIPKAGPFVEHIDCAMRHSGTATHWLFLPAF